MLNRGLSSCRGIDNNYEIRQYICKLQSAFSVGVCLFSFFYAACSFVMVCDKNGCGAFLISLSQTILAAMWFCVFWFVRPRSVYIFTFSNIATTFFMLEFGYYLYGELAVSYTALVIISILTSITFIGCCLNYSLMIIGMVIVDVLITVDRYEKGLYCQEMIKYLIDIFFVAVISIGMHILFSKIKLREFSLNENLIKLGNQDPLTGLFNRRAAERIVAAYNGSASLCAMIIIDLDNFKSLNDTMGHSVGDLLLIRFSKEITACFRADDCICRLGGDEFMVFMPNLHLKEDAIKKANDVLNIFPIVYSRNEVSVSVTGSIGVAFSNTPHDDLFSSLYERADALMYESKVGGKNRISIKGIS